MSEVVLCIIEIIVSVVLGGVIAKVIRKALPMFGMISTEIIEKTHGVNQTFYGRDFA